jgi:propionyl-CoA carboxylase alpha chain
MMAGLKADEGRRTVTIAKLLIANRGEIAARIFRTAKAMDIATVAVFSDADADALRVREADEAVRLPGATPAETYLRGDLSSRPRRERVPTRSIPATASLSENAGFAGSARGRD